MELDSSGLQNELRDLSPHPALRRKSNNTEESVAKAPARPGVGAGGSGGDQRPQRLFLMRLGWQRGWGRTGKTV